MTKSKGNKPLDRDYFKYKDRPKNKDEKDVTPCCNQDVDRNIIDKKNIFIANKKNNITATSIKNVNDQIEKVKEPVNKDRVLIDQNIGVQFEEEKSEHYILGLHGQLDLFDEVQ